MSRCMIDLSRKSHDGWYPGRVPNMAWAFCKISRDVQRRGREIVALGSSGGSKSDMYTGNYIFITEIHCRGIRIFFHYGYVYVAWGYFIISEGSCIDVLQSYDRQFFGCVVQIRNCWESPLSPGDHLLIVSASFCTNFQFCAGRAAYSTCAYCIHSSN